MASAARERSPLTVLLLPSRQAPAQAAVRAECALNGRRYKKQALASAPPLCLRAVATVGGELKRNARRGEAQRGRAATRGAGTREARVSDLEKRRIRHRRNSATHRLTSEVFDAHHTSMAPFSSPTAKSSVSPPPRAATVAATAVTGCGGKMALSSRICRGVSSSNAPLTRHTRTDLSREPVANSVSQGNHEQLRSARRA